MTPVMAAQGFPEAGRVTGDVKEAVLATAPEVITWLGDLGSRTEDAKVCSGAHILCLKRASDAREITFSNQ